MMAKGEEGRVYFKPSARTLHSGLVKRGLNSQTFTDFVRTAFHERIDRINADVIIGRKIKGVAQ